MFYFDHLDLHNFKSFYGDHKFTFPKKCGLYYLTGLNQENPQLGANGAGKSTILDAINWCLYGKTSRGLKAGDIVSWGEKSSSVTLTVRINDDEYVISRHQSPNKLLLNGTVVEQHALDKAIRLNQASFQSAVAMPQFGESFFDLSPTAKLNLLSDILELDFWLEQSQSASSAVKTLETQIKDVERAISTAEGKIETIQSDITALKGSAADFDNEKLLAVKALQAKRADVALKINQLLADEQKLVKEKLPKSVKTKLRELEYEQRDLSRSIRDYKGLKAVCSTCQQAVDPKHVKDHVEKSSKRLIDVEKQHKELLLIDTKIDDLASVMDEITTHEKAYAGFSVQIKQEKERENPYTWMMAEKAERIAQLKATASAKNDELNSLAENLASVQFWIAGFKRVRLHIIDQTLRNLELEVNSNLATLGLPDWRIEFDVEKETKAGGITRSFTVLVYGPKNATPIRFEAFSGGEGQLLRLASALGLANLIMSRAGLVSKVEFYDEPSTHLSQESILNLAETLHQRATSLDKQIWLIDHSAINFGDFAGKVRVTKDRKGSTSFN